MEATTEAEVHAKLLSQSSGDEPPTTTSTTAHSAKPPHSKSQLVNLGAKNDPQNCPNKTLTSFWTFMWLSCELLCT